jgi:hypothetical protein
MTDRSSSSTTVDLSELAVRAAQVLDALDVGRAYDLLLIKRSDGWTLLAKATAGSQGAESQVNTWEIKAMLA